MNLKQKGEVTKKAVLSFIFTFLVVIFFAQPVFAAPGSVEANLKIDQAFTKVGSSLPVSGIFTYELTAKETFFPMPEGSQDGKYTFTIDGPDSKSIILPIDNVGIYRYELKQIISEAKTGYNLDRNMYTITIYVEHNNGGLNVQTIFENSNGDKTETVHFNNTYQPEKSNSDIMVDPPVKKTVEGNPSQKSSFEFLLSARNAGNPMPAGSENGKKKIVIKGSGEEDFGTWSYTAEGTYYYDISEINTEIPGYTYDTSIYTITDTVKDIDGTLSVERMITNKFDKPVQAYAFINQYNTTKDSGSNSGSVIGPKTGDDLGFGTYAAATIIASILTLACAAVLIFNKLGDKNHAETKKEDNLPK